MEEDPKAHITVIDHDPAFRLNQPVIITMARSLCASLHLAQVELCLSFVASEEIRELNRNFRHIDAPTDVLSFPQVSWQSPLSVRGGEAPVALTEDGKPLKRGKAPLVLGDLVIALEVAEKNAADLGQSLDRELGFLIIHGLLHLGGHDHMNAAEEAAMVAEQEVLLASLQEDGDHPLWQGCVTRKRQVKKDDR